MAATANGAARTTNWALVEAAHGMMATRADGPTTRTGGSVVDGGGADAVGRRCYRVGAMMMIRCGPCMNPGVAASALIVNHPSSAGA